MHPVSTRTASRTTSRRATPPSTTGSRLNMPVPPGRTERHHTLEWLGWVDPTSTMEAFDIDMDFSYSAFGPARPPRRRSVLPGPRLRHRQRPTHAVRHPDWRGATDLPTGHLAGRRAAGLRSRVVQRGPARPRRARGVAQPHRRQPGRRLLGHRHQLPRRLLPARAGQAVGRRHPGLRRQPEHPDVDGRPLARLHPGARRDDDVEPGVEWRHRPLHLHDDGAGRRRGPAADAAGQLRRQSPGPGSRRQPAGRRPRR